MELGQCSHTTVIKDMCADCGADLRQDEPSSSSSKASVPMIHSVPELKVTETLAKKLGQADTERLLSDRKLVLLVDLDQTFYVYSSFWQKNELAAGGTVISIAVGLEHAAVNFKCQIQHGTGDVATGKLHFVRLDHPTGSIKAPNSEVFVVYKLLCKVARDFGQPTEVIYTDTAQSIKRYVPLRVLESRSVQQKMTMTACVDMTDYLELEEEFRMPSAVLQYFLHHQIVGVEDFIVYNSNALNGATASLLYSHGIKINLLPYNFPFDLADRHQNRLLIEMDCLMRNYNAAKLTYIGAINEYLYPSSRLRVNNQFLKYAWKVSSDVSRFSIASRRNTMIGRYILFCFD